MITLIVQVAPHQGAAARYVEVAGVLCDDGLLGRDQTRADSRDAPV